MVIHAVLERNPEFVFSQNESVNLDKVWPIFNFSFFPNSYHFYLSFSLWNAHYINIKTIVILAIQSYSFTPRHETKPPHTLPVLCSIHYCKAVYMNVKLAKKKNLNQLNPHTVCQNNLLIKKKNSPIASFTSRSCVCGGAKIGI